MFKSLNFNHYLVFLSVFLCCRFFKDIFNLYEIFNINLFLIQMILFGFKPRDNLTHIEFERMTMENCTTTESVPGT